ncbi:hypothetical protein WD019_19115 [Fictibacillus sp. Mic-4]|uniref:MerR family transcriptional regulator n=1 Tax=Fictibacillus TaxID=1329200 RepID=UPI0003F92F44|nr:hypothetical protein [Fictibacillus gelatini]HAJ3957206.1 hypothetical protein [Escherichia coli]
MDNGKWRPIGEVAKLHDITVPRLRLWCDKGLVEYDKRSNSRYIPDYEWKKIEKIKKMFDQGEKNGTKVTFDDVRTELVKDQLLEQKEEDQEQKKADRMMKIALERMLNDSIKASFEEIAAGFIQIKENMSEIQEQLKNPLHVEDKQAQARFDQVDMQLKAMASMIERLEREKEEEARRRKAAEERIQELTDLFRTYVESNSALGKKKTSSEEDEMKVQVTKIMLRDEAENLWRQKPATERQKKSGWFGKEEDLEKKDRFIADYIEAHLNKRLRNE